jgi:alkylation response protein AidB-like acyl-CoA dehydrogenase
MHLHPTDEQAMLRESIERFARDHADRRPDLLMTGLAGLGLLALPVPETAGGLGGDGFDLMGMMQAVGRALMPVPLAGTVAALDLLGNHGTNSQQTRWLEPAMEGTTRLAFARLESAVQDRLSGVIPLVPGADIADALVLVTKDAAVVVQTDAPGVQITPLRMADGVMGARVTLKGAAADPLAVTPDQISDSLARHVAGVTAQMLGLMERLLADTLDYVKTRQQFGTAIGSFQTIQHRMARMFTETELCRSLVLAASNRHAPRAIWLRHVAAAQAIISEQAMHLAQECVQFHGGMGITEELAVSRGHRQIMALVRLTRSV